MVLKLLDLMLELDIDWTYCALLLFARPTVFHELATLWFQNVANLLPTNELLNFSSIYCHNIYIVSFLVAFSAVVKLIPKDISALTFDI